jgi:hypothetical protein
MGNSKSAHQDRSFYEPESDEYKKRDEYISLISSRIEYGFRGKCGKNYKINNITDIPEYKTKLDALPEKNELLGLFNKALRKESSLCHKYYCFYSSTQKKYRMLYDAYKILHHMRSGTDIDMNSFLFRYEGEFFNDAPSFIKMFRPENYIDTSKWFSEDLGCTEAVFNEYHDVPKELEDNYRKKTGDSLKSWNDHNKALMNQMIACNVNLEGNPRNPGESTLHFILECTSIGVINILGTIQKTYKKYFDDNKLNELLEDFKTFYNKYNTGYGAVLSQIFIKKEHISDNVILCGPYGQIFCSPENNATLLDADEFEYKNVLLQELKKIYISKHPDRLCKINGVTCNKKNLQARIIYNDEFVNSDKVLVFNYTTGIDMEDYYYDLLSIANKYLPYIKNKEQPPYIEVEEEIKVHQPSVEEQPPSVEVIITSKDKLLYERAVDFLREHDQRILLDISKKYEVKYGPLYIGNHNDILDSVNYSNLHNFISKLGDHFTLNKNNIIMLPTIQKLVKSIKTNDYKKIDALFKEHNIWFEGNPTDKFNDTLYINTLNTQINEILNKLDVLGGTHNKLKEFLLY